MSEAENWADGTVEIQKSRMSTIFFHREPSLVPSLPISNSRLVWNDWKSWERCRAWISSICVHWMRAGKVIPKTHILHHSRQQGNRLGDLLTLGKITKQKGTLEDPIIVKSFGDEQYIGCTGCPADSHVVIWLVTSRERPAQRCPECGSNYQMEYVGPQDDGHGHDHGHGAHDEHVYEEPKTMADFVKPAYR